MPESEGENGGLTDHPSDCRAEEKAAHKKHKLGAKTGVRMCRNLSLSRHLAGLRLAPIVFRRPEMI